ncbi:MAG: glycosyltransferase family 4 protein [Pirellula sp.]|jgi:glycosyltransferase involved in cell wall biosynthesis
MKVAHIQRCPPPGANSIEKLFASIRGELQNLSVDVVLERAPHLSQGIRNRILNIRWAGTIGADVLHITGDIHYVSLGTKKRKTILTIHDLEMLNRLKGWRRSVVKLLWFTIPIKRTRVITCISKATEQRLLSICRIDEKKIRVIPNLLPKAFPFSPKSEMVEKPRILFVGTKHNKNLERVAAAIQGMNSSLAIVGKLDETQRSILAEHRIEYVNFVGIDDQQMENQYRLADLLCFPSLEEGFGLPIIEAQSIGRPVVTSNLSSMPEVAGAGACLVDPYSVESIRSGINKVVSDSAYRKQLIEIGHVNQKRFVPAAIASQYLELYREVAAG